MLTDAHWDEAHRTRTRTGRLTAVVGTAGMAVFTIPGILIADAVHLGFWRYVVGGVAVMVLGMPAVAAMVRLSERQAEKTEQRLRSMTARLNEAVAIAEQEVTKRDAAAIRQQFESRLANALDMADGEGEVLEVIERSLASVLPAAPSELLLADNSQAHLVRMASVGVVGESRGCSVDSPANCPAARRAQIQRFDDTTALDACPKLRGRSDESFSAVCVPVSIMGRTVGVLHTTAQPPAPPDEEQVGNLATLAKLAGARLGMLRAMADTQLQASTDSLTGLLNRRSFEQKAAEGRRNHSLVTVVMADLDHFKRLNDTYGHETGDRALRLFARVMRESLRGADVLCRYGGEEFAVALPSCSAADAERALESVRSRLDAAITVSGLPKFTASFGVAQMHAEEDTQTALARADVALFAAKRQGRDRIVVDDGTLKKGLEALRGRDLEASGAGHDLHPASTPLIILPAQDPNESLED